MQFPEPEKSLENAKREKLRREKPLVFEKVVRIEDRYRQGIATPIIDIAYSYACNLSCEHCTASRFRKRGARKLRPGDLRRISDEADALGLCHLAMSTNGHFLTAEKATHLKAVGLDKVKISLDDFGEAEHDANRNDAGAYRKAMEALFNARDAGLSVVIQTVVTHQNCRSRQLEEMARFADREGFSVDVLVARATGAWEGRHDVLVDQEDAEHLRRLHETHPVLHRDTFPSYGMDKGCGCVDSTLHITQYGDVLPCVYVHIALGSVFEESLGDLITRGQSIRCFSEHSSLCLSGEDREFIDRYMTRFYGKPLPIHWSEAFCDDDFVEGKAP
jgi:MoaA/NifB/PqqE/SkfB family radical SAM enzyme